MQYVIEGVLFGLSLSILLGPIFIALTQSSIEQGHKAGLSVGLGIWISDLIFIIITYLFINKISETVTGDQFKLIMGIIGGLVLIVFGLLAIFRQPQLGDRGKFSGLRHYFQFFSKGFLVNTINPFTFVFWISVISTYVLGKGTNKTESLLFLGSILMVIIITDSLKVFLANLLRKILKEIHVIWINRIAGISLGIFGVLLIIWSVK